MPSPALHLDEAPNILSWLNDTLAGESNNDLTSLEAQLADLITAADISAQDTSAEIERIIDDVARGAPRLTYDLHFMRDGALSLQADLAKVQEKSRNSIPEGTSRALDRLQFLDTVKNRMVAARDVLREAESWSSLEAEVTSLLTDRSYEKAAERLNEANKSMVVFQNTSEYESRRTLMVSLQNQLEASLSSALVAAINSQDVAQCRNFFFIFSNIQRESEFRNYYNGSRRGSLVALWRNVALSDCGSTASLTIDASPQTLSAFWSVFCTNFLTVLNAERASIPSIFPDPPNTLSTLIISTLSSLQPTFSQHLASLCNNLGSSSLRELIILYKTTEDFAANTARIMEKIRFSEVLRSPMAMEGNASEGANPSKLPSRRRSMRMSMSWRSNSASNASHASKTQARLPDELEWDQVLFQPFLDYQVSYGSLERRLLEDELAHILTSDTTMTEADRGRLLRERAVDVFSAAEESLTRCMAFTHGYGSTGLVQALDHFLPTFIDKWTSSVVTSRSNLSTIATASESDEDLSDLDYSAEDWSDIQLSLHLLTSARAVLERLTVFETKLRASLIQVAIAFRLAENDHTGLYLPGTTKGEGLLLAQSELNSAELQDLLRTIEVNSQTRSTQSPSATPLLTGARASIAAFAKACQSSLQNTILNPLRNHLAIYAMSPLWTSPGDPKSMRVGSGGINDLQVPVFSLSPSDVVQRVAEGLLNLPRLFEVYAVDDALSFSLSTLPYVDPEFLRALADQSPADQVGSGHARRGSSSTLKQSLLSPEAVSSAWLSSLGHSILSHLTIDVLPKIRSLTVAGAAQLASDLAYLSNIARALNVEYQDLERWKECANMSDQEGKLAIGEKLAGDQVLAQVARMRGWNQAN
ncbi:Golgi complex component 7-domain-containing protein [Hygrophoropsis aurantiaca]|uniref:Golgi complex component 7-domain-containing protein n=1 Tax=Hygrophoropsis aurantiaca TaxID=72124 RepID=A0ACB8AE54_9AGAM|nr:Golgi complex component 7-domain-containing protein [Hygrophoropsis aurantiaca]